MPRPLGNIYNYRGNEYTMKELSDLPHCVRTYNSLSYCIRKTKSTVEFCVEAPLNSKSSGKIDPVEVPENYANLELNPKQFKLKKEFVEFQELMAYMKPTSVSNDPERWKSYG